MLLVVFSVLALGKAIDQSTADYVIGGKYLMIIYLFS